jgi:hypothetical protein
MLLLLRRRSSSLLGANNRLSPMEPLPTSASSRTLGPLKCEIDKVDFSRRYRHMNSNKKGEREMEGKGRRG